MADTARGMAPLQSPPDSVSSTPRPSGDQYGDAAPLTPEAGDDAAPLCLGRVPYATKHWQLMPYPPQRYLQDKAQVQAELLAGITVAFAQVSESIAFAFIAGVGPLLGLHAAWIIGLSLSVFGTRSGMINGATGVRAAVVAPYVAEYGVGMLFYIVMAISVYQALAAVFKVAKLVKLIPRPAMIGFLNGLAIILAVGQLNQFRRPGSDVYLASDVIGWMLFLVGMTVIASLTLPRIRALKRLPPSLLGIITAAVLEWALLRNVGIATPTIGDIGRIDGALPIPFFLDPQYAGKLPPLNLETIGVAATAAFIASAAGMVEAVLCMSAVDDLTHTDNPRPNQQLLALAIGNFISGVFGTMGGGATIGLSVINVTNGANGQHRISGVVAGITMLLLIVAASPVIKVIPTASLVGVMVIVCFKTFEWSSLAIVFASVLPPRLRQRYGMTRKVPRMDAFVIVLVTVVTLVVDLFTAVLAGVLLSAAAHAWTESAQLRVHKEQARGDADKRLVIRIDGPVFFASAMELQRLVVPDESDPDDVEMHFSGDGPTDFTALNVLNVIGKKYQDMGKRLHLRAVSRRSTKLLCKADKMVRHFTYQTVETIDTSEAQLDEPLPLHVVASSSLVAAATAPPPAAPTLPRNTSSAVLLDQVDVATPPVLSPPSVSPGADVTADDTAANGLALDGAAVAGLSTVAEDAALPASLRQDSHCDDDAAATTATNAADAATASADDDSARDASAAPCADNDVTAADSPAEIGAVDPAGRGDNATPPL